MKLLTKPLDPWDQDSPTLKQAAQKKSGGRSLSCPKGSFSFKSLIAQKSGSLWTPAKEFYFVFIVRHSTQLLLDSTKENTAGDSGICYIFILSHLPPPLNNPRSLHGDLLPRRWIAQDCACPWASPAFQFSFLPASTGGEDVLKVTPRNILRHWGWSTTDTKQRRSGGFSEALHSLTKAQSSPCKAVLVLLSQPTLSPA